MWLGNFDALGPMRRVAQAGPDGAAAAAQGLVFPHPAHRQGLLLVLPPKAEPKSTGTAGHSSPIATADGRIYFVSTGRSYVIKASPNPEILGGGNLGGWGNGSAPAVSGGRIFVRDFQFLWCLGVK